MKIKNIIVFYTEPIQKPIFRHLLDPFELKFQSIAHLIVTLLVLCIGLIPWIDNWSHLFGTIFGLITSISGSFQIFPEKKLKFPNCFLLPVVYPYMDFGDKDYDPLLQYISSTVPKSPLVQRGSMSTIINIADMRTAQGYGQWANAFPYRGDQGRTPVFTAQVIWKFLRKKFNNKRSVRGLNLTIFLNQCFYHNLKKILKNSKKCLVCVLFNFTIKIEY